MNKKNKKKQTDFYFLELSLHFVFLESIKGIRNCSVTQTSMSNIPNQNIGIIGSPCHILISIGNRVRMRVRGRFIKKTKIDCNLLFIYTCNYDVFP